MRWLISTPLVQTMIVRLSPGKSPEPWSRLM
jgi:hypothetical protein